MTEAAIAFDTHKFVKNLTEHGFTEEQAEVLAVEHVALLNGNLATKTDIEALCKETKTEIEGLRKETKAGIEALRLDTKAALEATKVELLKWIFAAMIAQATLIVALVKLL